MSDNPHAIDGPIILLVNLEAKSVEAAGEIIRLLFDIKNAGIPGMLTFRINQSEKKIMLYEEYADQAALTLTEQSDALAKLKETMMAGDGLLTKPIERQYYNERKDK